MNRISLLIRKYIVAKISDEEMAELTKWVEDSTSNKETFQRLTNLKNLEKEMVRRKMVSHQRPMRDMKARIAALTSHDAASSAKGKSIMPILAMSAAACIAILLVLNLWTRTDSHLSPRTTVPEASTLAIASINDITHGETKAQLTLDDGTVIELDGDQEKNAEKMQKATENQSILSELKTNKLNLSIPRGGEFKVILEDGTEVWLNAESQLIYPEHFSDNERRVELKGEAYFKVAKNTEKPFYVESAGQQIRVTGTEFNVNSYAEGQHVFTTLVNGSIAIRPLNGKGGEVVLTPGHQAVFDKQQQKAQLRSVDTSVVTSWVKGSFVFEDQTLAQIMQDLSRWYNFHYQFMTPQAANTVFMGSVPRYGDFNDVLTILEKSGNLKFKIENNKLLIY